MGKKKKASDTPSLRFGEIQALCLDMERLNAALSVARKAITAEHVRQSAQWDALADLAQQLAYVTPILTNKLQEMLQVLIAANNRQKTLASEPVKT